MQSSNNTPVIAIDLGTSYTRAGVWIDGEVVIIPNENWGKSIPSYVAFTDKGRLFGDEAKNYAAWCPKNTIYDSKRLP